MHAIWHGFFGLSAIHLLKLMLLKNRVLRKALDVAWLLSVSSCCYVIAHIPSMPVSCAMCTLSTQIKSMCLVSSEYMDRKYKSSSLCKTIKY